MSVSKRILVGVVLLSLTLLASFLFFTREANNYDSSLTDFVPDSSEVESDNFSSQRVQVEPLKHSLDEVDSIWLVVNKQRPISTDYIPSDLVDVDVAKREDKSVEELQLRQVAAAALEELFAAAARDGHELLLGSAYRSAELQAFYYNNYVASYGQEEADKFSARPGTSEHQTGLAADVSGVSRECYLETCFGDTAEGMWVAANAHSYGFVVRYPLDKESITGYQYEPWHLRYVGTELAAEVYVAQQTLEEYFNL